MVKALGATGLDTLLMAAVVSAAILDITVRQNARQIVDNLLKDGKKNHFLDPIPCPKQISVLSLDNR